MKYNESQGMKAERGGSKWGAGKFANMPTEVKQQEYKKRSYAMGESLDDTIEGIDSNMEFNAGKVRNNKSKTMY